MLAAAPPHLASVARAQCPTVVSSASATPDLSRGLGALIRAEFGTHVSSNGTSFRDPRVMSLGSLPLGVRRALAARCGTTVAEHSVVVTVRFPHEHSINATWRIVVVPTHGGWRIWAYD